MKKFISCVIRVFGADLHNSRHMTIALGEDERWRHGRRLCAIQSHQGEQILDHERVVTKFLQGLIMFKSNIPLDIIFCNYLVFS